MGLSFSHLFLVLVVVLIVFGAGKLPRVMGDLARGLRSFKDGLKEEDLEDVAKKPQISSKTTPLKASRGSKKSQKGLSK